MDARLSLAVEPHPVTLHFSGAEGVVFTDARLAVGNGGEEPASDVRLWIRVAEGGKAPLVEGEFRLADVGGPDALAPGETARTSLFRFLQREGKGFSSRVNFFGYKAAVGWDYGVELRVRPDGDAPPGEAMRFTLRWSPDPADAGRILLAVTEG